LEHATEVHANKLLEKSLTSVAFGLDIGDLALGNEDFIGEIGTSLKGKDLGQNEGVVAVEENGGDFVL
jgi:hypothetical protein